MALPMGALSFSTPWKAPWGGALPWAVAATALSPPPEGLLQPPPPKTATLAALLQPGLLQQFDGFSAVVTARTVGVPIQQCAWRKQQHHRRGPR
jgi:hypothetical protein